MVPRVRRAVFLSPRFILLGSLVVLGHWYISAFFGVTCISVLLPRCFVAAFLRSGVLLRLCSSSFGRWLAGGKSSARSILLLFLLSYSGLIALRPCLHRHRFLCSTCPSRFLRWMPRRSAIAHSRVFAQECFTSAHDQRSSDTYTLFVHTNESLSPVHTRIS